MAGAQGIRAGRAFVEIGVDTTKLGQGLNLAKARLKDFGEGLKTVGKGIMTGGAAAVGALGGAALLFSKIGDDIAKMGERTGTTTEFLSTMKFATDQSGSSLEDLEKGLRQMNKAMVEGADGSKSYQDAFAKLGVNIADLQSMNVEDRFYAVADAISKVVDPGERSALAMELLGRAGTKLLPLMKDGAAGMKLLQDEARSLGLEMSGQTAKDAEELNDAIGRVKSQLTAAAYSVGAALAPAIVELSKRITPILARIIEWVQANAGLIVSGAKMALIVTALGGALFGLGQAILWAVSAGSALAAAWTFITGVISAAGAVIAGIGAPILIAVGIIAAAAVAFVIWRQEITTFVSEVVQGMQLTEGVIGDVTTTVVGYFANLFGFLAAGWSQLVTDTQTAMGGIADALKAGDLMLAAQILWAFIKLEWARGVAFVSDIWQVLKATGLTLFTELKFAVIERISELSTAIASIWIDMTAGMAAVFSNFVTPFLEKWYTIQGEIEKIILKIMSLWNDALDLDTENKTIDAEVKTKIEALRKENEAKNANYNDQKTANEQMFQQEKVQNAALKEQELQAIEDNRNAAITASDQKVRGLEKDLAGLREKAANAVESGAAQAEDGGLSPIQPLTTPSITVTDNQIAENITRAVTGTLSGFGASFAGFTAGADANERRVEQAQLETAKNTKRIADKMDDAEPIGFEA